MRYEIRDLNFEISRADILHRYSSRCQQLHHVRPSIDADPLGMILLTQMGRFPCIDSYPPTILNPNPFGPL
ncbi:hypothetical protein QR98_0062570 [Sarcoptes scabiei]|uniref:Uncharacterized protein n=1 Tax=Sarcoptes scabiei TaxID=52283 RepID=A0A132AA22_SARSC|nr:hypothetical protein QR98_0062570 [Sarcoptes scabiei]